MTGTTRRRGFVFLAMLGIMAVTTLIAFAMAGATQFSYTMTGLALADVQEQVMARTAAEYAMLLLVQKKMGADGKPQPFAIATHEPTRGALSGEIAAFETNADHPLYKSSALTWRPGDVLVHVVSPQMLKQFGRGDRWLLCNSAGKRTRAIDITSFRQALARP